MTSNTPPTELESLLLHARTLRAQITHRELLRNDGEFKRLVQDADARIKREMSYIERITSERHLAPMELERLQAALGDAEEAVLAERTRLMTEGRELATSRRVRRGEPARPSKSSPEREALITQLCTTFDLDRESALAIVRGR